MPENKFPTEMVTLPSKGYFYPENSPLSKGEVEMKYMTAREEDILTSPNLIRSGVVLDKLIESLLVDKKIKVDDLLLGDKNGLIVAARILAYGKEYPIEFLDENGQTQTITVDLTTLKDKEIDFSKFTKGVNEFSLELPNTKRTVTFRLLTQRDDKQIDVQLKSLRKVNTGGVQNEFTTRLKRMLLSVDGNDDRAHVNNFVDKEFLSVDSLELRKYLTKITPDIEMTTTYTEESGEESEVTVPMTVQFFWPDS